MTDINTILTYMKYTLAICVVISVALAPAWLARQTKKNKNANGWVRIFSWLLGWTGIGWLIALFIAVKK